MTVWICRTCAVEYAESTQPPPRCLICSDERQYVRPEGQRWITMAQLIDEGHRGEVAEVEPGLSGITVAPKVGIGQRALLVTTPGGNLLWDPTGYVDDAMAEAVRALGGASAIAASHPHMFGAQVEWSRHLGGVPVLVQERDVGWAQRGDAVIQTWGEQAEPVSGVTLHRIGGHFPGSAVARFVGVDGRVVLLTGDTVAGTPDEHWVSFMRSYPNQVPLSAAVVERLAIRVLALEPDRLYDNVGGRVRGAASVWVRRSADRYAAWVRGDFDQLTD